MSAAHLAAKDGVRAGCRGQLTCVRAVGLFFGTQAGKTEEAANIIASETGLEAKDIGDISAADLEGFDGVIAGVPTWHTGADEQRSGTAWDDYLEEIRALNMCGKPVAIFGMGDSVGYGDNFCDAIEELHSTFEAAGAKMLGYTDPSGYENYQESKSVKDGKFLGLPLDGDNEPDKTEDRVKTWVAQLKSEGMPIG
jgi:flavodoxin I